jgi:tetratricopeptide (TPR) repeat protein
MTDAKTFKLAMESQHAGDWARAVELYRQVLARDPNHVASLSNMAMALTAQGQWDLAIAAFRKSLELEPGKAETHLNLGSALAAIGEFDQAESCFTQALAIQPDLVQAHANLARALQSQGKWVQSFEQLKKALAHRPEDAGLHNQIGNAMAHLGNMDGAMKAFRNAIALRPDYVEAQANLGGALRVKGELREAIEVLRAATRLDPKHIGAHTNLGSVLRDEGELEEAIACLNRAAAIQPDFAPVRWNLAMALLSKGDFARGWPEFEWRLRIPQFGARAVLSVPKWDGRELNGARIFLFGEQGYGDVIQFVRYLPQVIARGGKVILSCQTELRRLVEGLPGVEKWLPPSVAPRGFDVHCPLMSLAGVFQTNLQTIPAEIPYLKAGAELSRRWKSRVPADGRLKVGLAWAGRPTHQHDRIRSMPLAAFLPVAKLPNVWLCSLQKGAAAKQAHPPPEGMEIVDWTDELGDFADTAALIENLDLVIAVDTAVVHLAGALGKPVWVLLQRVPDWRWMMDRSDTPWYPTMRLFRQADFGDWVTPMKQIAGALVEFSSGRRGVGGG